MASSSSSSPVTLDTPITFKVNIRGTTRRFKLPLRDVGINVLEGKVCWYRTHPPPPGHAHR